MSNPKSTLRSGLGPQRFQPTRTGGLSELPIMRDHDRILAYVLGPQERRAQVDRIERAEDRRHGLTRAPEHRGRNLQHRGLIQKAVHGFAEVGQALAVILGVRTRFVAFVLSGEMAVAYWSTHVGLGGLWFWSNGGELTVLYCLTFLLMATIGGGDFSVDGFLEKRNGPPAPQRS